MTGGTQPMTAAESSSALSARQVTATGALQVRPGADMARRTVRGRFGPLEIAPASALHLQGGMLGFPQERYYCLIDYPGRDQFKLLQSLSYDDLCFIVYPVPPENRFHEVNDIYRAAVTAGFPSETLLLLLTVSAGEGADGVRKITCNVRAPVFVNAAAKAARQVVLPDAKYAMRAEI